MKRLLLIIAAACLASCSDNATWKYEKFRDSMGTTDLVFLSDENVWIGRDTEGAVWQLSWDDDTGRMKKIKLFPSRP